MADHEPERLKEDVLFLACTRPAMFGGVTLEAFSINLMLSGLVFIIMGSMLYLAIGGVFHAIFRQLCKHDPNMFRVLFAWVGTKGRCRASRYWGASSSSPLRVRRPQTLRQLQRQMA